MLEHEIFVPEYESIVSEHEICARARSDLSVFELSGFYCIRTWTIEAYDTVLDLCVAMVIAVAVVALAVPGPCPVAAARAAGAPVAPPRRPRRL